MTDSGGSNHGQSTRHGADRSELRLSPTLNALDNLTVRVEKPVRRIAGSARLNPLPHAGTISVFLLGVVVVSGLYITLFYEFGHEASYLSVQSMEAHAIQRVIRALHRYASAALVVTTIVHGWRILTAARFTGRQRRLRWASGIASLVLVWLAGVSGYWLIWDVRAQALNELVIGFIGGTATGADIAISYLGVLGGQSGSSFMLLLWFVHLGLTVAIGFFTFRHLRRTNLAWLPPRHMMAVMGGALVLASLAIPVGMLAPANPNRLIGEIPLDPFVLFLLPPLLSDTRWLVLGLFLVLFLVALMLPRLLQNRDPQTIIIDEEACTGCDLCVIDCPYQALTLSESDEASDRQIVSSPVAVVDRDLCVSCGVCIGSCAFGAIELPGFDPTPPLDFDGKSLVVACDRHLHRDLLLDPDLQLHLDPDLDLPGDGAVVHQVGCAGMISADAIRLFADSGATAVHVIGCAPNDCRYGLGNTLASQRLSGERSPHPARKFAPIISQDWVPADRFEAAVAAPGLHPSADANQAPRKREALIGIGLLAVMTVVGVAFATRAPFEPSFDDAAVRVVVDHRTGQALRASEDTQTVGALSEVELELDQQVVATLRSGADTRWAEVIDLHLDIDPTATEDAGLAVYRVDGDRRVLITEVELLSTAGARTVVDLTDVPPPPTVADGRRIFNSRTGGCSVCHSVEQGDDGVGPSLAGVGSVAATRVEGLSAEQYLEQSILLPDQYIVEGWPAGQMLPIYRDRLTAEQLDAVVGYLLTLEGISDENEE